jgi:FkbM family methyltransferase
LWGLSKVGIVPSVKIFLARYLPGTWQIQPRGYSFPIEIRGQTSDTKLFFDVILHEEYPVPDFQPSLIVDAGANIGLFSIYYATRFPNTPIIAIEPETGNFEILSRNTTYFPNVVCIRKGLWSEATRMKISNPDSEKWSFELETDPTGDIETISMNELLTGSVDSPPQALVKIDIEGADRDVFARNIEWLDQTRALYIEVHGSWRQLFKALEPFNYEVVTMRENLLISINSPEHK